MSIRKRKRLNRKETKQWVRNKRRERRGAPPKEFKRTAKKRAKFEERQKRKDARKNRKIVITKRNFVPNLVLASLGLRKLRRFI